MRLLYLILPIVWVQGLPYYYQRDRKAIKTNKVSPAFGPLALDQSEGRMLGLDTGNDAADFEAGMWLMALVINFYPFEPTLRYYTEILQSTFLYSRSLF